MEQTKLERDVRFLKLYSIGSTLVLLVLSLAAFEYAHTERFSEIDVERINVIEPDGRPALVIANSQRLPGAIWQGQELRERSGTAGILFYNAQGTESGGLTYRTRETEEGYSAEGLLAFDQYNQDQVVALMYSDGRSERSAGLRVWDRPADLTIRDVIDTLQVVQRLEGPARAEAQRELQAAIGRGEFGAHRIFVGSQDRTAAIRMNDTAGRTRIRIYVDSLDAARLEFLDEAGQVIQRIPEDG